MKCNVGSIERKLRIVAGLAIIAGGIYFESWWGAIGVMPLLTGSTGWCPAYVPFGISTNRRCDVKDKSTTE